jgi:hypothetical protein
MNDYKTLCKQYDNLRMSMPTSDLEVYEWRKELKRLKRSIEEIK